MTTTDIAGLCERLRAALEGVTPGPWYQGHNENGSTQGEMSVWPDARMAGAMIAMAGNKMPWDGWFEQPARDARFIALSREAVPALLDTLERQAAEIERLRGALWPFAQVKPTANSGFVNICALNVDVIAARAALTTGEGK